EFFAVAAEHEGLLLRGHGFVFAAPAVMLQPRPAHGFLHVFLRLGSSPIDRNPRSVRLSGQVHDAREAGHAKTLAMTGPLSIVSPFNPDPPRRFHMNIDTLARQIAAGELVHALRMTDDHWPELD